MAINTKKSWLWIFISVFIIIWIGDQLVEALFDGRIVNLRKAEYVLYNREPGWFIFVVSYRLLLFIGCLIYLLLTFLNIDVFNLMRKLEKRIGKLGKG